MPSSYERVVPISYEFVGWTKKSFRIEIPIRADVDCVLQMKSSSYAGLKIKMKAHTCAKAYNGPILTNKVSLESCDQALSPYRLLIM